MARMQEVLVMPWVLKWLPPLLGLLPLQIRDAALDVGGARCAMQDFVGRRCEQRDSTS